VIAATEVVRYKPTLNTGAMKKFFDCIDWLAGEAINHFLDLYAFL